MSWFRASLTDLNQTLLPVGMLLSEICGLVYVVGPLWREDGSAVCNAITQWQSHAERVTILYCLFWDSPKCGGPGSCSYISYKQGGTVVPLGTGLSLRRLLREVRWGYFKTDGQSVSMSWYRAPLWNFWPDITFCWNVSVWNLRSCFCGAPSLTRRRVCNLQNKHSISWVAQNS
jgi:hypothetical protein